MSVGINGTQMIVTGVGAIGDNGILAPSIDRDVDLVRMPLDAGTVVRLTASATSIGSPLDPYVIVFDELGRVLSQNNDFSGSRDSFLVFTAPRTGTYYVGVSASNNFAYNPNVFNSGRDGGSQGQYQLTLDITPRFNPTLVGNKIQIDGARSVTLPANSSLQLIGAQGLVDSTAIPVFLLANMTADQVATELQRAMEDQLVGTDAYTTFRRVGASITLTGVNVASAGPFTISGGRTETCSPMGIVPIVNENDTVATDELKFGDNDTLSALVASLIGAQWLFLMTDVDRLYTADPRQSEDAQPIDLVSVDALQSLNINTSSTGSSWGTGGMATKIAAARIATNAGVRTVITHGGKPYKIMDIVQGKTVTATQFAPQLQPDSARKRWIAFGLVPQGKLYLDEGAVKALTSYDKSLLPAGIVQVEGQFNPGDSVQLCDRDGNQIGRGLVKYNHRDIELVKGEHSDRVEAILGNERPSTIVHRDDLVLLC
ncbi:MAG: glutamate 5-kinase [Synechococcaceae cyanobacterium RL_1_2]|nr:glutamate 5-kinase [Synechococcaceae cyanobacterium RL_1_2]